MPSSAGMLHVKLVKGYHLHWAGAVVSPFVKFELEGELKQSLTKVEDPSPEWNEDFQFNVQKPALETLYVEVYHNPGFMLHELIGSCVLRLSTLPRKMASTLTLELREQDPITGLMHALDPPCNITLKVTAHGFGQDPSAPDQCEGSPDASSSVPLGGPRLWQGAAMDTTSTHQCQETYCKVEFGLLSWKYPCHRCGKVLCHGHAQNRHPFEGHLVVLCRECFAVAEGLLPRAMLARTRSSLSTEARTRSSLSTEVAAGPAPHVRTPALCGSHRPEPAILTSDRLRSLVTAFPVLMCESWALLFSNLEHGNSYQTLYGNIHDVGNLVLLVMTDQGQVFGAFLPAPLSPSEGLHYQGNGNTVVFDLEGQPALYTWSKENPYYVLCQPHGLAVGGGGSAAIWLDEDMVHGSTGPCDTFRSPALCRPGDGRTSTQFGVYCVEIWHVATLDMFGDAFKKMPKSTEHVDMYNSRAEEVATPSSVVSNPKHKPVQYLLVGGGDQALAQAKAWLEGVRQDQDEFGVLRHDGSDVLDAVQREVQDKGYDVVVHAAHAAAGDSLTAGLCRSAAVKSVVVLHGAVECEGEGPPARHKWMVCVDSASDKTAMVRALVKVLKPQDRVVVYSAYTPPDPGPGFPKKLRQATFRAQVWTALVFDILHEAAVVSPSDIVVKIACTAEPAEACLRYATEHGVQTIVCGQRAQAAPEESLLDAPALGSFAAHVSACALCQAVWIVR